MPGRFKQGFENQQPAGPQPFPDLREQASIQKKDIDNEAIASDGDIERIEVRANALDRRVAAFQKR
jgi:hypothetical protein